MRLAFLILLAIPLVAQQADPYQMVWSDEFSGEAGTAPDSKFWGYDTGNSGFGNAEMETYTTSTDNVFQDGKGNLVIRALASSDPTVKYTSGRIKTQSKFTMEYGKIEARIKIPRGQGLWPAFWMLGANLDTAGWPGAGEIDIMENIGKEPALVHGTVHGPGYSGADGISGSSKPNGAPFADDFHVYGVIWKPNDVQFLIDNTLYFEVTPAKLPKGAAWVYDHPFFVILNVAVGGYWPGYPDSTTTFPQDMTVDYVRVYRSTLEPVVNHAAVVNAASFLPQLAPGSLASLFGTGLASAPGSADVSVTVDSRPAWLTYVSPLQINFQVPWSTPLDRPVDVAVARGGVVSAAESITVTAAAPSLFLVSGCVADGTCTGWGNGFGAKVAASVDGVPSRSALVTTDACILTIGMLPANVKYCGVAPGLLIDQLNFVYPAGLAAGTDPLPATLQIGHYTGSFLVPRPS